MKRIGLVVFVIIIRTILQIKDIVIFGENAVHSVLLILKGCISFRTIYFFPIKVIGGRFQFLFYIDSIDLWVSYGLDHN